MVLLSNEHFEPLLGIVVGQESKFQATVEASVLGLRRQQKITDIDDLIAVAVHQAF